MPATAPEQPLEPRPLPASAHDTSAPTGAAASLAPTELGAPAASGTPSAQPTRLRDVIDPAALQSLLDDFYAVTRIGVGIIDLDGTVLVGTGWQDICTKFHRANPVTCARCIESDTVLTRDVPPGEFRLYRCRNHMWDIATPIVIDGQRLGNLFLGQFLFEGEAIDREFFRAQARAVGFDEEAYLAALDRVPRWSKATVDTVMAFYLKLARLVASLGASRFALQRALAERDRLLGEVRASEGRFRSLVESSPTGMHLYRLEPDGALVLTDTNPAADSVLGVTHAPLHGKRIEEAFPNLVGTPIPDMYRSVARGALGPQRFQTPYEDGQIAGVYEVVAFRTGPSTMAVDFVDVSARKREEVERERLREQLRASQKMEAVGRLAGGIAHDFNNLLTVILNCARLARESVSEVDPVREDLEEIARSAERAASLTRQLLAFSRRQLLQPRVVSWNQVVASLESMLERLLGENIALVRRVEPEPWLTRADPGQLEQVVMNLAVNARDAMPEGGTLTLETSNERIPRDGGPRVGAPPPGDYALLTVRDSGHGMSDETRAHLFEPFFTTKGPGAGTGLGLSTVFGIVKQTGGEIAVDSAPGRGTVFRVYLPRHAAEAAEVEPPSRPRPQRPQGTGSVLFVEDEPAVRTLGKRLLEESGFRVQALGSPLEAVELFAQDPMAFDLLVSDVIMPGMSGRALAERLRATRPSLRVLFISGYTDDVIGQHGVLDVGTHFLAKPFTGAELAAKVLEVLGGAAHTHDGSP